MCTTEHRALLCCALALSFCTTTNSVVLSQLRSAQDSNTCVLRFNEKYSVNFRIFSNFTFWQCYLESVLKRVTVLKLQTTNNLSEVWKVYIFIMDQGKTIFTWFKILGYFCQSHENFSVDSWICLEAQKEIEMKRFYKITWNVSSLTLSCKFNKIVQTNEKGLLLLFF